MSGCVGVGLFTVERKAFQGSGVYFGFRVWGGRERGLTLGERSRCGERRRTMSRSLGLSPGFEEEDEKDLVSRDGSGSRFEVDDRDRFSAHRAEIITLWGQVTPRRSHMLH